ncbi:N-acetylmuramoyl-L-alanine amidase [Halocynthiibacter styelae]|uniref:N-acetylmuramoyl-L-alanine amidase n=1 Tax=Halocynthiibacter styelae TaxID=2761955 RepID=A0A8J7IEV8_9RHOB|nr:N-acetylmuramoyl-L-alanine amidase [Paenihalocynthiibacter styelae]MBI1494157.1 N-acetylmuramoyl-L-alanine amidase [Paenihalocynthiibacter styelae]
MITKLRANGFIAAFLGLALLASQPLTAQDRFTGQARVIPDSTIVTEATDGGFSMALTLSQGVPFQVYTLADPMRLVLDFNEVTWRDLDRTKLRNLSGVSDLRAGALRPGWSRLVLELNKPLGVRSAFMRIDDASQQATLNLNVISVPEEAFLAGAGAPDTGVAADEDVVDVPGEIIRRQQGDRALTVVLDPGHGGVDPGAQRQGLNEADLMLDFARALREELVRAGGFNVVLTRNDNSFISLERRVTIARAARADLFISLHADTVSEGQATGTTIYTLSDEASDRASALLAERHDREDLLAGVDLRRHDDQIAMVLMDMARRETAPRSTHLAQQLVASIRQDIGNLYKRPHLEAGFSVLKAPDIPSVLIELGFMNNPNDLNRILSSEWEQSMTRAIRRALQEWALQDAAEAQLIRQ